MFIAQIKYLKFMVGKSVNLEFTYKKSLKFNLWLYVLYKNKTFYSQRKDFTNKKSYSKN